MVENDNTKLILKAEARTAQLENALRKAAAATSKHSAQMAAAMGKNARKMEALLNGVGRAAESSAGKLARMGKASADTGRGIGGFSAGGDALLGRLSALVGAVLSVRQIVDYSDAWKTAGNQIAAAGVPLADVQRRLENLNSVAIDSSFTVPSVSFLGWPWKR